MLPGEAVLTVRSSLIHCQHVGVGRAGEDQLPHREVPHRPQASVFVRAQEPLRAFYTFVLHGFILFTVLPADSTDHHLCLLTALISFCPSCCRFFFCAPRVRAVRLSTPPAGRATTRSNQCMQALTALGLQLIMISINNYSATSC